jgi:gas vesicle protein
MYKHPLDSIDQLDESASSGSYSRFATGLMVGALAGAAVALLFAPSTGQKLRRQLRDGASKLGTRAREMYADASSAAGAAAGSAGRQSSSPTSPRRETTSAS